MSTIPVIPVANGTRDIWEYDKPEIKMQRNVKTVFMEVDIRIENRVFLILDYKNQKFNIQKIISSEDNLIGKSFVFPVKTSRCT